MILFYFLKDTDCRNAVYGFSEDINNVIPKTELLFTVIIIGDTKSKFLTDCFKLDTFKST